MKIRIRAWDKEEKKMISADDLAFEEYAPLSMLLSDSRFDFELSTGLFDKNGVEIFEGDILDDSYANPMTDELVVQRYILVNEDLQWKMKDIAGEKGYDRYLFMHKDIEVIGNIHESEVEE